MDLEAQIQKAFSGSDIDERQSSRKVLLEYFFKEAHIVLQHILDSLKNPLNDPQPVLLLLKKFLDEDEARNNIIFFILPI